VHGLLGREVVEEVRLREPRGRGDAVERGAVEAVGREDAERRL
jgi:hypothetical protein